MAQLVDLDAARKARAEVQRELPTVVFGGQTFTLPAELPWSLAEAASDPQRAIHAVRELLGEQWDDFTSHHPTVEDMTVLLTAVGELYGGSTGK